MTAPPITAYATSPGAAVAVVPVSVPILGPALREALAEVIRESVQELTTVGVRPN